MEPLLVRFIDTPNAVAGSIANWLAKKPSMP